jgi:hypothetical protein
MYTIEVAKEITQFFWPMRPDHRLVIIVTEPADGVVVVPADCQFIEVIHEELATNK